MTAEETLAALDALLGELEDHWQCEECGRWHRLSGARVHVVRCGCGLDALVDTT